MTLKLVLNCSKFDHVNLSKSWILAIGIFEVNHQLKKWMLSYKFFYFGMTFNCILCTPINHRDQYPIIDENLLAYRKIICLSIVFRWHLFRIERWTLRNSVQLQSAHTNLKLVKSGSILHLQHLSILNRRVIGQSQQRNQHGYVYIQDFFFFAKYNVYIQDLRFFIQYNHIYLQLFLSIVHLFEFVKLLMQELNVGPTAHSILKEWIRGDGKLSLLGYTKFLHGVTLRSSNTRHQQLFLEFGKRQQLIIMAFKGFEGRSFPVRGGRQKLCTNEIQQSQRGFRLGNLNWQKFSLLSKSSHIAEIRSGFSFKL